MIWAVSLLSPDLRTRGLTPHKNDSVFVVSLSLVDVKHPRTH